MGIEDGPRTNAAEWLTTYLWKRGGSCAAASVKNDAVKVGMTMRTLERAARDMGVIKLAPAVRPPTWQLPPEVMDELNG